MTDAAYAPAAQPWDDLPTAPPGQASQSALPGGQLSTTTDPHTGRPLLQVVPAAPAAWEHLPTEPPPPKEPARQVGTGEAVLTGAKSGLTFGFEPEYQGMSEAGNEVLKRMVPAQYAEHLQYVPSPIKAHIGAAVRLAEWASNHDDPEVAAAAERGRKFAEETVDLSKEQHPWGFYGGMIGGSLMLPGFGPEITAARIAKGAVPAIERIASGVAQGGLYGGLQGTGEAVSEGKSLPEVAGRAGKGIVFGAGTGGVLHGAIGPRGAPAVPTAGQRAAATAEELGAPLPKGIASDRPAVQGTTARLQSVPLTGTGITRRVAKTGEAAGKRIGEISERMAPGVTSRAEAGPEISGGLEHVIDANHREIDAAYDKLRSFLPGQGDGSIHAMPRTKAALDTVAARRAARGRDTGDLQQFRNIENGTTFNGAQAARTDARSPGLAAKQHPGFDAHDWRHIEKAMTEDLKDMVQQGAVGNAKDPQEALRAFKEADAKFGPLAEQNEKLHKLVGGGPEALVAKLIGKAGETGGDLRTLAELRQAMPPDRFAQIGAAILREVGLRSGEQGRQFSLRTFANGWDKLSDGAKGALFDPAHRRNIDDIVDMTRHIGGALTESNTSKTANALLLWDLGKSVVEAGAMVAAGVYSPSTLAYAVGGAAALHGLSIILGSPAKAAATRSWLAARTAWAAGPTPARTAVFKIATRNLGKNIGLDPGQIVRLLETKGTGKAEPDESSRGKNN